MEMWYSFKIISQLLIKRSFVSPISGNKKKQNEKNAL